MKRSFYMNRGWRIFLALIASLFILFHGKWHVVVFAFTSHLFYIALAFSFPIAFLLMEWIHYTTLYLDKKMPWADNVMKRSWYQALFGFFIPIAIDLIAVNIFLSFEGLNIITSGYISIDFPVVLSALLIINIYYFIKVFIRYIDRVHLEINYNGTNVVLDCNDEVGIVYKEAKYLNVITMKGEVFRYMANIGEFAENVKETNLVRVNRKTVLNLNIVEGSQRVGKVILPIIKPEFEMILPKPEDAQINITPDYLNAFKIKFASYRKLRKVQNIRMSENDVSNLDMTI